MTDGTTAIEPKSKIAKDIAWGIGDAAASAIAPITVSTIKRIKSQLESEAEKEKKKAGEMFGRTIV